MSYLGNNFQVASCGVFNLKQKGQYGRAGAAYLVAAFSQSL
jgi:hypothetical protein